MFWKATKPLLSDKLCIKDRLNISEKRKLLKGQKQLRL